MKFVALQLRYLKIMGIDFYNPSSLRTKFFKMFPLIILIIFSFGQMHPIYVNRNNVMFITEILSYLLNNVAAIVKITIFITAQGRFIEIYNRMEHLYNTSRDEVKSNITASDKKNEKILKVYYIAYLIAAGVLGIIPVIASSPAWRKRFHGDEPTKKLAPYLNRYITSMTFCFHQLNILVEFP